MALGDDVGTIIGSLAEAPAIGVATTEYKNPWVTVIDNGGMETQDAAAVLDPDAEITNSTTHILNVGGRGNTLYLRMRYDDGITPNADPVVQVFGRHSPADQWMKLPNSNATPTIQITIVTAEATDVTDGTDLYTDVSTTAGEVTVPLLGCDQVIIGVTTAFTVSGGDATLASLQAKVATRESAVV